MLSHNEAYEFLSKLQSVFINISPYRPYGGIASAAVTKKNEKEVRYRAYLEEAKEMVSCPKNSRKSRKKKPI